MIGVKQEEFIHLSGNENDLVKFENCLSWQEFTSGIKDCPKICLPVIFHALFGQRNDQPKCQNPSEYQCMMLASVEILVRKGPDNLALGLGHLGRFLGSR
jgi:hypothetical protein